MDIPAAAGQSRATRSAPPPRYATNRSRISNGQEILPGVDQRLAIARRYRDLVAAIAQDQGGADRCSEARMQFIRRFASGAVLAEALEARLVRGEEVDIAEHALAEFDFGADWPKNWHQQGGQEHHSLISEILRGPP